MFANEWFYYYKTFWNYLHILILLLGKALKSADGIVQVKFGSKPCVVSSVTFDTIICKTTESKTSGMKSISVTVSASMVSAQLQLSSRAMKWCLQDVFNEPRYLDRTSCKR